MSKIKSVSQFEDGIWGTETPIGADASNVDVEMSDSSTKDLQTVLGDIPSAAAPIQSQINTKVTASGGNIGNTTVSSGIQNFDSSSSETSTELLDTSVRVTNATEVTSSTWTKFNRFRKRVDNKFKDVFLSSVEDVASPSDYKTYSQSALNDYFANVVGYASASDLPDATSTIAQQLSTLNNNFSFERVEGASNISRYNCSGGTIHTYDCVWEINQTHTLFHFMCRIGLWDVTRTGGNPGVKMIFPFSSYFTEAMDFKCIGRYGAGNANQTQFEQANGNFDISDGYFYLKATETTANIPTSSSIFFSCNAWYNLQ